MLAEFDPIAQVMVAVIDDSDPARPRQVTGAPLTPGVQPLLLPLRAHWPDPYFPDLPQLLGPMVLSYDPDAGTLTQTWPVAAFTPEAVRAARGVNIDRAAREALFLTDWAVVRKMETGKDIPSDIAERRAQVRRWHTWTRAELADSAVSDLVEPARWDMPEHLRAYAQ